MNDVSKGNFSKNERKKKRNIEHDVRPVNDRE